MVGRVGVDHAQSTGRGDEAQAWCTQLLPCAMPRHMPLATRCCSCLPPVLMPGQLLYVRSTAKPQAPSRRADVLLGAVPFGSACAWAARQAAGELWQQRPRLMGLTTRPGSLDAWWRRRLPPRRPPVRGREPGSTCRPVACPGTPAPSWPQIIPNRPHGAAGGHSLRVRHSWWRWLLSTRSGVVAGLPGLQPGAGPQQRGRARAAPTGASLALLQCSAGSDQVQGERPGQTERQQNAGGAALPRAFHLASLMSRRNQRLFSSPFSNRERHAGLFAPMPRSREGNHSARQARQRTKPGLHCRRSCVRAERSKA